MEAKQDMKTGAVGMMDCLAWKAITNRAEDWPNVLATMREMKTSALRMMESLGEPKMSEIPGTDITLAESARPEIQFLSDTIVCGTTCTVTSGEKSLPITDPKAILRYRFQALLSTSRLLSLCILYGIKADPIMLYRGGIVEDGYLFEDDFILGPAVDWAAQNYETSITPAVWCAPSISTFVEELKEKIDPPSELHALFVSYPVLFHGGYRVTLEVLNPFYANFFSDTGVDLKPVLERVAKLTAVDQIDIVIKREEAFALLGKAWNDTASLKSK